MLFSSMVHCHCGAIWHVFAMVWSSLMMPPASPLRHMFANAPDQRFRIHRIDDGDTMEIPTPIPPNHFRSNPQMGIGQDIAGDPVPGTAGDGTTGATLITAKQYEKADAEAYTTAAQPHDNEPQSLWLWTLYKL